MSFWEGASDETDHGEGDVEEPSEPNRPDNASGSESLDPKSENEPAPCAHEISRSFPEEDEDGAADDAGNSRSEEEEAFEFHGGGFDTLENAKANDENDARESEGIEADEEDG